MSKYFYILLFPLSPWQDGGGNWHASFSRAVRWARSRARPQAQRLCCAHKISLKQWFSNRLRPVQFQCHPSLWIHFSGTTEPRYHTPLPTQRRVRQQVQRMSKDNGWNHTGFHSWWAEVIHLLGNRQYIFITIFVGKSRDSNLKAITAF